MILKGIIDSDTINYKKISMVLEFPYCTFKCDKECGMQACQNSKLASASNMNVSIDYIIQLYLNNPLTEAIIMQGLEPFDSWYELKPFIHEFRKYSNDDIVIYTGYKEDESFSIVEELLKYKNIIIKFGRFIPNQTPHYDEILGVNLASDNQYAKQIC